MSRVQLTDTGMDVLMKMAGGNPGALTACMEIMSKIPEGRGLMVLLRLDDIGIYEDRLYMLWNDCCNRNIEEFDKLMRNNQFGKVTDEQLRQAVAGGRGRPFENLMTYEELEKEAWGEGLK